VKRFGLPIVIALVVAVMGGLFVLGQQQPDKPSENQNTPRVETGEEQIANQGQDHIEAGANHAGYNSNPPTSGPHHPRPTDWGVKDSAIPDETLVHNLEHGGIVINYRPDIGEDKIQQLKQIFRSLPPSEQFNTIKAVLVPRPSNDRPISVTAWTYLMHLDSPEEAKIKQFYSDHVDKGPELVP
jgi:hypothetical protein